MALLIVDTARYDDVGIEAMFLRLGGVYVLLVERYVYNKIWI